MLKVVEAEQFYTFRFYLCLSPERPVFIIYTTYLYMASIAIPEVSKVKGQGVWPHSSLYYKAEVCLMAALSPAHILVMVDELFSGQKHTEKNEKSS